MVWVGLLWELLGLSYPGMSCVLLTDQEVPKKLIRKVIWPAKEH